MFSRCCSAALPARGLLVLPLFMFYWCGCDGGPPLGQVSGIVRLDGEPLEGATVIFQPLEGGPASHGTTGAEGQYELLFSKGRPGAVVGNHRVTLETYRITLNEAGEAEEVPERLPARYNAQSQLEREVAAGEQTMNFELESD